MGRKKKAVVEATEAVEPVEVKAEPKVFEYGDLAVVCKCGRTQIVHKGIKHGLQVMLATREDSKLQLICDECGADITLCFIEGEKPEGEEEEKLEVKTEADLEITENDSETVVKYREENESIQEESKQE